MSPSIKSVVKAIIAAVVAIGLVFAFRGAWKQWQEQKAVALERVSELDRKLQDAERADPPASRQQVRALTQQRDDALAKVPRLTNLRWSLVSLSALLYAIGLFPGGVVYCQAVRTLGYRVSIRDCVTSQIIGHLGKYIPGKAMVVVIRAGRLSNAGVPIVPGSVAVFIETLMMMAVGAAIAGFLILFLPVPRWIAWTAMFGGLLAMFPTLPPVLRKLLPKLMRAKLSKGVDPGDSAKEFEAAESEPLMQREWRLFASAWFWQVIAWLLIGGSFACLVESVPGGLATPSSGLTIYLASVASIALAMVAGFASLLPGGAGVRELTLAVVLAPVAGASQALLAAILARLVFIVVELMAALAASGLSRIR